MSSFGAFPAELETERLRLRRWRPADAEEYRGLVVEAAANMRRERLWATVRDWNAAAFRVLEKLGFYRSDRVTADPERGDTIWMTRDLGQV
ncbi:hypothetical protein ACXC9Q_31510 [Kribbella sp. CWNU-51]